MHVMFGKYKGRIIYTGNNDKLRPTMGQIKKNIFNLIKINDTDIVLDLFSGSGALGIEAISLGAKKVIFVEKNNERVDLIKKTLQTFVPNESYLLIKTSYQNIVIKNDDKYNLIFLDPPHGNLNYYQRSLKIIFDNNLLENNGKVVIESNQKISFNQDHFIIYREKKYGSIFITILERK